MADKNWNERWGDESNDWSRRRKSWGTHNQKTNDKYLRCLNEGMQCLVINEQLLMQIKTRLLLGMIQFDVTGLAGVPTAMVSGSPIRAIYVGDKRISATYKGKGKWLFIVG